MAVEITKDFVWQAIPPRPRESHKGTFGAVLAVAGSASYRGAALLAAEGALRTGAGIVTLASVEPVLAAAAARLPECCLCPCAAGAEGGISPESIPFIQRQKATVLLLGPGLGGTAQSAARAAETRVLVQRLLPGFAGSAVLDADGLNAAAQLLAEGKALPHPTGELILTPHPGEMARLTGLSVAEISTDREKIAQQYAKKWNVVVVLKGSRTIVAAPDGRASIKESVSLEPPAMTSFLSVLTFLKASTRYRIPFSGTRRPRNNMYESFFSPNLSLIRLASRICGLFTPLGIKCVSLP